MLQGNHRDWKEIQEMEPIGTLDTLDGEFHIVYDETEIIAGSVTNVGLFPDFTWEREYPSVEEDLQAFVEELQGRQGLELAS